MKIPSMPEWNIIGDAAAEFDLVLALLAQMPKAPILFVGDIIDRGPKSKEILDFVMNTPNVYSLRGNHEQLMIDSVRGGIANPMLLADLRYAWLKYGGKRTIRSFGVGLELPFDDEGLSHLEYLRAQNAYIGAIKNYPGVDKYLDFLERLPLAHRQDGLLVTHAAVSAELDDWEDGLIDDGRYERGNFVLWHRGPPKRREGLFQVFGHNNWMGARWFKEVNGASHSIATYQDPLPDNAFALCVDDSKVAMTGVHWPSLKVYQQTKP